MLQNAIVMGAIETSCLPSTQAVAMMYPIDSVVSGRGGRAFHLSSGSVFFRGCFTMFLQAPYCFLYYVLAGVFTRDRVFTKTDVVIVAQCKLS